MAMVEDKKKIYDEIPEGSYTFRVDDVIYNDKFGPRMTIIFSVTGPNYIGRKYFDNYPISTTDGYFIAQANRINPAIGLPTEWTKDEIREKLVGRRVAVKIAKNKKGYRTLYINKVLSADLI